MDTRLSATQLDCAELSISEVNRALRALPDGSAARISNPRGTHNLAVGLTNRLDITIDGNAGYYIAGLCDGPDITVNGFVGWSVGGEPDERDGPGPRQRLGVGGGVQPRRARSIIEGDASSRAGISLKGGTVCVAGDVGHMSGFMAQAGDDPHRWRRRRGARRLALRGRDLRRRADPRRWARTPGWRTSPTTTSRWSRSSAPAAGFDHIEPANVTRVASARQLYNFERPQGPEVLMDEPHGHARAQPPSRPRSSTRCTPWPRRAATRSAAGAPSVACPPSTTSCS